MPAKKEQKGRRSLNDRDMRFVDGIAKGKSQAQAYRDAGFEADHTARTNAVTKVRSPAIQEAIAARRAEFRAMADVEAKEIIGAHTDIAFSSIEDLLDENGNLDLEKARENGSIRLIRKLTRQVTKNGANFSFELYSRTDALNQLTEILGLKQMPRENAESMTKVMNSYNLWLEKNPTATTEDKSEAIVQFAKGGNVDQRELAKRIGIEPANELVN